MSRAVIVLGHGSRRQEANEEISHLVMMLKERQPALEVVAAYAEFAKPTLEEAVAQLASQGREQITIVPLFLTVGNHLNQKLPEKVNVLAQQYGHITIAMTKHIGADPLIVQILEDRILEQ